MILKKKMGRPNIDEMPEVSGASEHSVYNDKQDA